MNSLRMPLAVRPAARGDGDRTGRAIGRKGAVNRRHDDVPDVDRVAAARARRARACVAVFAAGMAAVCGCGHALAQGAANVGVELSPRVAWEPDGPDTRAVGLRRLNSAEVKLAQQRAAGLYEAFVASPSFRTPRDRAHHVASYAGIEAPGEDPRAGKPVLQQTVVVTWSVPRDVRRRADGALVGVLGGAHDMLFFELNYLPRPDHLLDRATSDFSRGVRNGHHGGYFAQPRVLGQVGGGTVYAEAVVFTRDGSNPLAPAPLGPLLDLEIERLAKVVADTERGSAQRIREAEQSMTPERVAERRAKRETLWSRETRDPARLAQRLDAAHRTDLEDLERTRREFSIPAQPDPRHRYWGPKLALEAARARAAAPGAGGRDQPACARLEPGFQPAYAVRFEAAGSAPDCVPMVQVRANLVDPKRPLDEVQLVMVPFRGLACGEVLGGLRRDAATDACGRTHTLLRELDWAALRRVLGWN